MRYIQDKPVHEELTLLLLGLLNCTESVKAPQCKQIVAMFPGNFRGMRWSYALEIDHLS